MPESNHADIPSVLPWERRLNGFLPMPGGYDGYFETLRMLCEHVADRFPPLDDLIEWWQEALSVAPTSAKLRMDFLRASGVLELDGEVCKLTDIARRWLDSGDDTVIIAQLHSRTRFVGEALSELHKAQLAGDSLKTSNLLDLANGRYGFDWKTANQIAFRRGWLQSAGLINSTDGKRLEVTDVGRSLLGQLELYEPPTAGVPPKPGTTTEVTSHDSLTPSSSPASAPATSEGESIASTDVSLRSAVTTKGQALAAEVQAAGVDSSDHTRFELAVRDAFDFLGFRAEQLGRSGRTDVLLDALRGKGHSYRVTVDAKSVGASGASKGQLRDQQVDWVTLQEHRAKHGADYSLLIGPDPTGERLFSRGREFGVAVMSSDELAQLCRQHERLPLGLGEYEGLFVTGGAVDTSAIDETFEAGIRRRDLAEAAYRTLISECANVGPMSVRDLWLTLRYQDPEQSWAEDEIREVLVILSSNLVAAVELAPGSSESPKTYVPATSLGVARLRLHRLADALGSSDS